MCNLETSVKKYSLLLPNNNFKCTMRNVAVEKIVYSKGGHCSRLPMGRPVEVRHGTSYGNRRSCMSNFKQNLLIGYNVANPQPQEMNVQLKALQCKVGWPATIPDLVAHKGRVNLTTNNCIKCGDQPVQLNSN